MTIANAQLVEDRYLFADEVRPDYDSYEWQAANLRADDGHPLVPFDASKQVVERAGAIGTHRLRCSPDIVHMMVEGTTSLSELGIQLTCDDTLPPNSMVAA